MKIFLSTVLLFYSGLSFSQESIVLVELKEFIRYSYVDDPKTAHYSVEKLPFTFEYIRDRDLMASPNSYFLIEKQKRNSPVELALETLTVFKVQPQLKAFKGEIIGVTGWDDGSGNLIECYIFFIDKNKKLIKYKHTSIRHDLIGGYGNAKGNAIYLKKLIKTLL